MDLKSGEFQHNLIIRFLLYLSNLTLIWIFFPPMYYKNDDVIMSMIAGGYGSMYEKSEIIFHSNIIIGYLAKYIPKFLEIQPYNLINIILIIYIFVVIQEIIFQLIKTLWISILTGNSLLFFLVVTPTFSTIAGCITVIGILGLTFYARNNNLRFLYFGLINIFIGSLIRDEQMLFTLVILLVFIRILFSKKHRKVYIALTIFFVLIGGSQLINRNSYESYNLQELVEFESVRYAITDYGADNLILQNPVLLDKSKLSTNDIKLIRNWYFFDSNLINVSHLQSLLDKSGWSGPLFNTNFVKVLKDSNKLLSTYPINILILWYFILLIIGIADKKIISSLFILLLMVLLGALVGRQLNYIYYPVVIGQLLLFIYLISWSKFKYLILTASSILILFFHLFENVDNKKSLYEAQKDFMTLDVKQIWMIGGGWSLQHIYPLFDTRAWKKDIRIIASDWSIFAEKSNARIFNKNNGFINAISSGKDINLVANHFHIPLLERYCLEKFGSKLNINNFQDNTFTNYYSMKCTNSKVNLVDEFLEFDQGGNQFLWITEENQSFYLSNYSDSDFTGKVPIYVISNPCKIDLDFQLSSKYFLKNYNSKSSVIIFDANLESFEQLEIKILPLKYIDCKNFNSDSRNLYFKISLKQL